MVIYAQLWLYRLYFWNVVKTYFLFQIISLAAFIYCFQWSYGVTMWEIFSGGKAPYPGTDPSSLLQKLEEEDRMPKPNNAACTEEM